MSTLSENLAYCGFILTVSGSWGWAILSIAAGPTPSRRGTRARLRLLGSVAILGCALLFPALVTLVSSTLT